MFRMRRLDFQAESSYRNSCELCTFSNRSEPIRAKPSKRARVNVVLVCVLPLDWILSSYENVIRLCKLSCSSTSAQVDLCVAIKQDLSWLLTYRDSIVDVDNCSALSQAPPVMDSGTNPLPLVLYVTVLFS